VGDPSPCPMRAPFPTGTAEASTIPGTAADRTPSPETGVTKMRFHMSTGAWIFTGLITAAVIAPTAAHAAATSTVAIGTHTSNTTANITANRQLLTTTVNPKDVVSRVRGYGPGDNHCESLYTPPTGKAIVVTEARYDLLAGEAPPFDDN